MQTGTIRRARRLLLPKKSPRAMHSPDLRPAIEGVAVMSDALLADGFEDAFIGFGTRFTYDVAVYDYDKCIEILERDMSYEDATEYFEFNTRGAYVGEHTPIFMTLDQGPT